MRTLCSFSILVLASCGTSNDDVGQAGVDGTDIPAEAADDVPANDDDAPSPAPSPLDPCAGAPMTYADLLARVSAADGRPEKIGDAIGTYERRSCSSSGCGAWEETAEPVVLWKRGEAPYYREWAYEVATSGELGLQVDRWGYLHLLYRSELETGSTTPDGVPQRLLFTLDCYVRRAPDGLAVLNTCNQLAFVTAYPNSWTVHAEDPFRDFMPAFDYGYRNVYGGWDDTHRVLVDTTASRLSAGCVSLTTHDTAPITRRWSLRAML